MVNEIGVLLASNSLWREKSNSRNPSETIVPFGIQKLKNLSIPLEKIESDSIMIHR